MSCLGRFIWRQCRKWGGRKTCTGLEINSGACFDCPSVRHWRLVIGRGSGEERIDTRMSESTVIGLKELCDLMTFNLFFLPEVCFPCKLKKKN